MRRQTKRLQKDEGNTTPGRRELGTDAGPNQARSQARPHVVWAVVSAVVLVLFAPGLFVAGFFTNELVSAEDTTAVVAQPSPSGGTPSAQPTAPTTPPPVVAASSDDDPFLGPADAPVTIIEFSDFQCPFCLRFWNETLPQIKEEYQGKVRFVYRDFPLVSIHEWAQKAAEAAECADDQKMFWEYHDLIFGNQDALSEQLNAEGLDEVQATFKSYAADLGLDAAAFDDCLDSGKYTSEVQKDVQDGQSYGVTGTPAFFINGQLVSGAQPFANFETVIDAALEEAEANDS
jgi:protein-disulfide isomerase